MRKERGAGSGAGGREDVDVETPRRAVEGGGAPGSRRRCFRCTPYQPAARCSDPMPMSEKSIVPGQGRGRREPQLQCGEGSWGPAIDLLALLPVPPASRDWTTWWGVGDTRRLRGPLLQAESRDLQRQSGAPGSTWTHPCVQVPTCVEAHGHRRTDPHGCPGVHKATRGPRRGQGTTAPTMALLCWSPCSAWSPSPEPGL